MNSQPHAVERQPAVAGKWYPGDAASLRSIVEQHLGRVAPVAQLGRVMALICPHAGYAYSGGIAAHAYAQVRGQGFRRVVLLGPLHQPLWPRRSGPVMAPEEAAYATPLGSVPIDQDFIVRLGQRIALTRIQGDREHALEIQLPFLQVVLDEFSLVPLLLGEDIARPATRPHIEALASALADLGDDATLFVASTDLSHLHDYAEVKLIDGRLAAYVDRFDVDGLIGALQRGEVQACGATGLVAAMLAAQKRGASKASVLAYASSGDVTGNIQPGQYTVGYLAAAICG